MGSPWKFPSTSSSLGNTEEAKTIDESQLATFWQRALAWLIDTAILAAIGEIFIHINPTEANGLSALVGLGYMVLLLGGPYGQSIGAKFANVRVVNLRGDPLGYWRATARYFVSGISAVILGLGYLWMLKDKKNQTLHDKVAGSLVISLKSKGGSAASDVNSWNS